MGKSTPVCSLTGEPCKCYTPDGCVQQKRKLQEEKDFKEVLRAMQELIWASVEDAADES